MDLDNVQLEVKNDEGVAPIAVRSSNAVAISNQRRKINLPFPQLLHFFESNVIKSGQNMKARLGYTVNLSLIMINHNEHI